MKLQLDVPTTSEVTASYAKVKLQLAMLQLAVPTNSEVAASCANSEVAASCANK